MDGGDGATGVEGDDDVVGGDDVGEFGDGQDVVRIFGEVGAEETATEGLNRAANRSERINGIFHQSMPSGAGETDLVGEMAHGKFFPGEGKFGFEQCARGAGGSQGKKRTKRVT